MRSLSAIKPLPSALQEKVSHHWSLVEVSVLLTFANIVMFISSLSFRINCLPIRQDLAISFNFFLTLIVI